MEDQGDLDAHQHDGVQGQGDLHASRPAEPHGQHQGRPEERVAEGYGAEVGGSEGDDLRGGPAGPPHQGDHPLREEEPGDAEEQHGGGAEEDGPEEGPGRPRRVPRPEPLRHGRGRRGAPARGGEDGELVEAARDAVAGAGCGAEAAGDLEDDEDGEDAHEPLGGDGEREAEDAPHHGGVGPRPPQAEAEARARHEPEPHRREHPPGDDRPPAGPEHADVRHPQAPVHEPEGQGDVEEVRPRQQHRRRLPRSRPAERGGGLHHHEHRDGPQRHHLEAGRPRFQGLARGPEERRQLPGEPPGGNAEEDAEEEGQHHPLAGRRRRPLPVPGAHPSGEDRHGAVGDPLEDHHGHGVDEARDGDGCDGPVAEGAHDPEVHEVEERVPPHAHDEGEAEAGDAGGGERGATFGRPGLRHGQGGRRPRRAEARPRPGSRGASGG